MSFWSSLKDTAESIGGALVAPVGVVYDLASAPFDEKDDNFGTIAAKASSRVSDLADPFFNEQTWTGAVFGKTMKALDTAYREGVSEPLSTLSTMGGHVVYDPVDNIGDIFSGEKWSEAYQTAQNRSIGQAFTSMVGAWAGHAGAEQVVLDPMDERAYKQIHNATPFVASMTSGTTDFIARWYLDPGNVAGKGVKLANQSLKYRKLTATDRVDLAEKMADAKAKRLGFPKFVHDNRDIGTRTQKYLEWSDGLEASALYHGTAELRHASAGQQVAGLLADANKIEDKVLRHDAKRRILAVAAGDDTQIRRLQDEITEAGSITDALKNMRRGTTLELKTQALVPSARNNPVFMASLDAQLARLDSDQAISKFVTAHQNRLDSMLDTAGDLRQLPGVHASGKRAVKREQGDPSALARLGAATNQRAKDFADRASAQSVFQKSVHHVPLLTVKTAGMLASPWTKTPGAINRGLRQQHFQGVVNLHDWTTASNQLDVMMKIAGVEHGTRLKTLSEVFLAKTEPEKMRLIDRIESESMKALWRQHGAKVDTDLGMDEYFDTLMSEGQRFRNQNLSQLRGRVYAAQQTADGVAKPRVDIIDDHGTPVALPLFETQLANQVPLFDVDLAKKLIKRDSSHMSRLARTWKAEKTELERLSALKAAGGTALDAAIQTRRAAMDWMVHLGQKSMRAWKFGVLFRLGYPIRVLMDDHMRIATQLNYGSLLLREGREGVGNFGYNYLGGRAAQVNRLTREAKRELRDLRDMLDRPEVTAFAERQDEIARINRSIAGKQASITKWKQRLALLEDPMYRQTLRPDLPPAPTGMFHGTRQRFENDAPGDIYSVGSGAGNLYGHGFYTTDAFDVAKTYQRKGGATEDQFVYSVKWNGEGQPNMLDLDEALHPSVKEWAEHQLARIEGEGSFDATEETFDELRRLVDEGASSGDVIRAARAMFASTGEMRKADIDDLVSMLSERLADEGYDGLKHVGGAIRGRGEREHGVNIFFDTSRLGLSEARDEGAEMIAAHEKKINDSIAALQKNIAEAEALIAEKRGAVEYLTEQLGDDPEDIKVAITSLEERLNLSRKARKGEVEKRHLGQKEIVLPGGYTATGAYAGPYGKAWMQSASSSDTFALQMEGAEDRMLNTFMRGSHRTIQPTEPGHLDAWADVVNRQFAMSKVARHFMKGGTVDEFVAKVKSPEWADLRARLPHFAHDAEDWGHRVQEIVRDYLPTDELRQAALSGRVKPRQLAKMFNDPTMRPAVHGNIAAYNLGDVSGAAQYVGKAMNRIYRALGEMPTDRLSRHPFFAAMYKQHIVELHSEALATAKRKGLAYTQADVQRLETVARKRALNDLKRTLFDISAHSHAAHTMRFVSPFFSAHQESLTRWWRIVSDDPGVVRKFQLAFDAPRNLGLVYDTETGDPVPKGEAPSTSHRILMRVPEAWGGSEDSTLDWTIGENSFNLVLQGGLMNPGAGPLVTVPIEALTKKYADEKEIAKVARVLNPYPPDTALDPLMPATVQRLHAAIQKEDSAEWSRQMSVNVNDALVGFVETHGRQPTKNEAERLMQRAGRQTNVDAWLRVAWNALSPAPARPESKYAVIQNGWYKISEQARAEGKDWQWARDRFVEKYSDIYLPLIYSSSLNAGDITMSTESVAQAKRHRGLLQRTDPALARMILGAEGEGEYSPEARQWFKDARIAPGSSATYISDQEPKQMLVDQIVRDGWTKYSALTGALTAKAQEMGLASYRDSDQLEAARKAAVAHLQETNPLWWNDYNDFNPTDYDQYVADMDEIAYAPGMQDTERQDILMLQGYLELRRMVVGELARRKEAGLPYSADANANQPLLQRYSALVGALVERSPDFETFMFNGLIERDPLLNGDPVQLAQDAGLVAAN